MLKLSFSRVAKGNFQHMRKNGREGLDLVKIENIRAADKTVWNKKKV